MTRRILTYVAAFLVGSAVWIAFGVVEAINPLLPWKYPFLILFTGIIFPGGATPGMHYLNHVAETWFPFVIAFLVASFLTGRRARFLGALVMYGAFLIWSWGMVLLDGFGVALETIFVIGVTGTFCGGLCFFLWLVDPGELRRSRKRH
ncbi:hypothetical protein C9E81_15550 [Paracoccus alkanivorans]|uniref:Uncharacterized protein n=1 Tax=Paracoccus alkanivorans TaxID=2116655 RepID=A0A3M0MDM8_9RHOB|nr:hypothetical protein C9E81_15550 [Paracoccus alkanivorans]